MAEPWGGGGGGTVVARKRVSTGAIGPGATAEVTVTWDTAFADANYTVPQPGIQEDTAAATNTISIRRMRDRTAASVKVVVVNNDVTPATTKTGTLHVIAIHD